MTDAPDPKLTLTQRLIAVTKAYGSNDADSLDVANMARVALPELSRLLEVEASLSELWTLRMMRMSCSVMTSQQSSEYAARSDAAWVAVQRVLEGK